jgi:hypothetical protein
MNTRMQMPAKSTAAPAQHLASAPFGTLQRKCACGGSGSSGGECAECSKKKLQRRTTDSVGTDAPSPSHTPSRASDQNSFRQKSRPGHDFGKIRIDSPSEIEHAEVDEPSTTSQRRFPSTYIRTAVLGPEKLTFSSSGHIERLAHPQSSFRTIAALSQGPANQYLTKEGTLIADVAPDAGSTKAPNPTSGSGTPGSGAAPACSFSVTYTNPTTTACSGGNCGASIVYDVTAVRATGTCPPLSGLTVTEAVTNDHGCVTANVQGGAGCQIGAGGSVQHCTDTYRMCFPPSAYPAAGCTETVTQQIGVGGTLAETHTIRFRINKSGGSCSGTATRT